MTGAQFWAVVALSLVVLAATYLIGFRDGAAEQARRYRIARRLP